MAPIEQNKNDTKLLLSVAGLVVAGAAGIFILAGLAADREAKQEAAERASSVPAARHTIPENVPGETAVQLAGFTREAEKEIEVAIAQVEPPAFVVDPNENFVARALETYEARKYDKAAAYMAAEIDARPQRAWSHYMLGLSLWKDGRTDEAVAAMEESAKLDSDSVKTFVNLSRIHNDGDDYEAALDAARTALSVEPGNAEALFLEARSLTNLGRLEDAVTSVEASLAADPDNAYAQNLLGLIHLRLDDEGSAVDPLTRAAELRPDIAFIQNNLGMALERTGDRESAVVAYRRAVEIDSGHGAAASNLARLEPTVPMPDPEPTESAVAAIDPEIVEIAAGATP